MLLIKKIILIFLLTVLIGAGFAGGFFAGKKSVKPAIIFGVQNPELGQPPGVDFSLFWETWRQIQEKLAFKEKVDTQNMIYGAISGMIQSLDDPYTVFFPPDETKKFKDDVKGTFEGVGMELGSKEGQLVVVSPIEGTPAKKAGLRPGDKILQINGTSTVGMDIDDAVSLIRGKKGTEVTLTIFREGWGDAKDFRLVRDIIEIPTLKLEFKNLPSGQVAYLALYQFSENAAYDFNKAAIDILYSKAQKIILDLRNNPGGYLEVAQSIAGWFLEKRQTVAIEDFGEGKEKVYYNSEGPSDLANYPVIVLINKGSASAAEILAGALRDNRGAQLIGEKSFGKGSVQELIDLPKGSSLKVTIAKWLTPKGALIADIGLDPDIKVEMTDKDFEEGRDPQLDKALEIIKDLK